MGVGLGGRDAGGDMYLAHDGVRVEATGKNCGVHHRKDYLQAV